jgi:hypothetical protein
MGSGRATMGSNDWMMGAGRSRDSSREQGYDVMQVCLNGHRITDSAEMLPDHMKPFCPDCGEKTIATCPECRAPIQGHLKGVLSARPSPVRNNCHQCGTAYPWRQAALAAAVEAAGIELEGQDATDAAALIVSVSVDTAQTELSALKLKRLLGKLSKPVYYVTIKIVSDVASETAKKILGLK